MAILVLKNEATAARRRVYFHCVDATDGITPEIGEAGGQPEISIDGAGWTSAGAVIGVLVAIGNGRYYATLSQAAVNLDDAVISTRYKSANTAESIGSTVQVLAIIEITFAAAAGVLSGAGTGTEVVYERDGVTPRATATIDAVGNRTAVVY